MDTIHPNVAQARRFVEILESLLPLDLQLVVGEKQQTIRLVEWEPLAKLIAALNVDDSSPRRVKNWHAALLKDGIEGPIFSKGILVVMQPMNYRSSLPIIWSESTCPKR